MSKKIAVLISDEFEDSEFTSPADEFRKAGHEVITIEKQAGKTVKGKKGSQRGIDKSIDEVTPAEFDALLLPGEPFTGLSAWRQPFCHLHPRFCE